MLLDLGNRLANQLLDILQIRNFLRFAQRDGDAAHPRTAGPANTVNIGFRDIRQVEVDDMGQLININSARSDVCSYQYAGRSALEVS